MILSVVFSAGCCTTGPLSVVMEHLPKSCCDGGSEKEKVPCDSSANRASDSLTANTQPAAARRHTRQNQMSDEPQNEHMQDSTAACTETNDIEEDTISPRAP